MRLSELQPFKSTPAYKSLKTYKGYERPDYKDIEDEKSHTHRKYAVTIDELYKIGWQKLGTGYYAYVLEHPNYPYVLKLFSDDPEWLAYMKYAQSNKNNPYVPKFRGKYISLGYDTYAVRMEKLSKYSGPEKLITYNYIDPSYPERYQTLDAVFDDNNTKYLTQHHPELVGLIKKMYDITEYRGDIDMHGNNVMWRDNTLVIIDF